MDRYEMEQLLTEIAAEIDPRARAVESGDRPYITFMSQYAAPEGWVGKGKWSQRFYPIGDDRADITEQFKKWLAKFERPDATNTKERSEQIFNTAFSVLETAGGPVKIDQLSLEDRWPILDEMYKSVMSQTGCVRETAKRNIAKALRRARYGEMVKRGGARPGPHPGRPLKEVSQDG